MDHLTLGVLALIAFFALGATAFFIVLFFEIIKDLLG